MTANKIDVQDFFNKYILGWMCSDIKNCIKAKANFAVAALLMTYTENIGSLIEGHLGLSRTSESDFNKFLEYFEFKGNPDYYKDFEISYQEPKSSAVTKANIYRVFRCGLIHEYSPKISCVIENHSDKLDYFNANDAGIGWVFPPIDVSNSSGYVRLPKRGELVLRFHTNAYFRDFKNAIYKFCDQIFNEKTHVNPKCPNQHREGAWENFDKPLTRSASLPNLPLSPCKGALFVLGSVVI